MSEFGNAEIIGAIITANVTIVLGAFALIRKTLTGNNNGQQVKQRPVVVSVECLIRIENFMDSTEKVLIEASKIQHTHSRYLNDVRIELSNLRNEISEMKGILR